MRIYGNAGTVALTAGMIKKGREPHSVMIHGEKGLGKKAMASFIAAQLMCEEGEGMPCGRCKSCRMIENGTHPDLYFAKPNDKGNYLVEEIREKIVADAPVLPNEGRIKVYVIPDLDRSTITSVQIQNILLKLIEEPPDHAAVIITAASKESFLPTIISRVLCLGAVHVTEQESAEFMQEKYPDKTAAEIGDAVRAGRGNIGRCREYIEKGQFYYAAELAAKTAEAFAGGSEYETAMALAGAEGKRGLLRDGIYLLSEIVRDASVLPIGAGELTGCSGSAARKLGAKYTAEECARIYDIIREHVRRIDQNCNAGLTVNSLTAALFRG
ncbi:MAG: hypothetical protein IJ737_06125 [Ruminococcus sp.]|nr:hypothetical protein [Ruminococcus sp.]